MNALASITRPRLCGLHALIVALAARHRLPCDLSAVCLPAFWLRRAQYMNPVFGSPILNLTTRATDLANRSSDYMTAVSVRGGLVMGY